jgi:hypothetical protein
MIAHTHMYLSVYNDTTATVTIITALITTTVKHSTVTSFLKDIPAVLHEARPSLKAVPHGSRRSNNNTRGGIEHYYCYTRDGITPALNKDKAADATIGTAGTVSGVNATVSGSSSAVQGSVRQQRQTAGNVEHTILSTCSQLAVWLLLCC